MNRLGWVALLAVTLISITRGADRAAVWAWASGSVALIAAACLLVVLPEGPAFEELLLGRALEPTGDIGDAWRALILEFERPSLRVASRRSSLWGAAFLAVALLVRHRARPSVIRREMPGPIRHVSD